MEELSRPLAHRLLVLGTHTDDSDSHATAVEVEASRSTVGRGHARAAWSGVWSGEDAVDRAMHRGECVGACALNGVRVGARAVVEGEPTLLCLGHSLHNHDAGTLDQGQQNTPHKRVSRDGFPTSCNRRREQGVDKEAREGV